jgi:CheY-like chemotaxis protein
MIKIMVVDDEPDQIFSIKKSLENFDSDYEVNRC